MGRDARLAATLAAHNQKGLPAFGIYGRDVQDAGDTRIPADVETKLLRFCRAALATATMRGKSYLSMGGTSMGMLQLISPMPTLGSALAPMPSSEPGPAGSSRRVGDTPDWSADAS